MELSEFLVTVEAVHHEARRRGLFFQHTTDERLRGRTVSLGGREVVSFASCSYLGLEHHPDLVAAVHDAVERYGTQFSASRGYLSAPLYGPLEEMLGELFGGHVLVTASTTIGHTVALPVLAGERDAIVMDHQVHHSVQTAATLARAAGAHIEVVRHGELERAEEIVGKLARTRRTVWFACDGVYSMFGDLAPLRLLERLLRVAPNVRLYVDDAHGMSWAGAHGCGSFLSRMALSERVVMATSLNKAFSAAGGCLVFASAEERERVRVCGGPMVFSGPLQPPMIGAALASARVHLSPEIGKRQRALAERTAHANQRLREAGLPLLSENASPIFFLGLGLPKVAFEVAERVLASGSYVCASAYPAVPMKRSGIRLTLTSAHSFDQIDRVIEQLAKHIPRVLAAEGSSVEQAVASFSRALPQESRLAAPVARVFVLADVRPSKVPARAHTTPTKARLRVQVHRSIADVDRDTWDACMGRLGMCNWETQRVLESVFASHPLPEHDSAFRYVLVRDEADVVVLATFFTTAMLKDDMLMRHEVSRAVEQRRAGNPYFLTSRAVMMGSLLSEGRHLYLDRSGPWQQALEAMLEVATSEYERAGASVLLLRDLPADDPEMDSVLLDHGLVKAPMLPSHVLTVERDLDAYERRLRRRSRMHLRQNVERANHYQRTVQAGPMSDEELRHLYGLYKNVASKNLRLNVFHLPPEILPALLASPSWEVVTLHLQPSVGGPSDSRPVAFFAAYQHADVYAGFLCGLDYRYVIEHGAYRQVLYQSLLRARETGASELRLGMGADVEKRRFGTVAHQNVVYLQARDDYGGAVLREIVAETGLREMV